MWAPAIPANFEFLLWVDKFSLCTATFRRECGSLFNGVNLGAFLTIAFGAVCVLVGFLLAVGRWDLLSVSAIQMERPERLHHGPIRVAHHSRFDFFCGWFDWCNWIPARKYEAVDRGKSVPICLLFDVNKISYRIIQGQVCSASVSTGTRPRAPIDPLPHFFFVLSAARMVPISLVSTAWSVVACIVTQLSWAIPGTGSRVVRTSAMTSSWYG